MGDSWPALAMGIALICLAVGMARYQWRHGQPTSEMDELARDHVRRQLRRRLQVSLLLGIAGVLIPLGDWLPVFRRSPGAFVIFWLAVMLLAGWIVLLALGDMASAQLYHRRAGNQLGRQRRELEDELRRHRERNSSAGHAGRNGSPIHSDE